jgi:N-acetylmuramoyl-L-alanine amidase
VREVRDIVIHATMTGDEDVTVKDLDRQHRRAGWNGVGYHFIITRDGVPRPGRPIYRSGAHVRGFDKYSVGICMVGQSESFTDQQWAALRAVCIDLTHLYPNAKVMGHRDCPRADTTCPSFDVAAWWATINA